MGCTKSLMQQLLGSGTELKVTRIDEGGLDGDLCAIVTAGAKEAVAIVWPTAEKLKQIKALAEVSATFINSTYMLQAGACRVAPFSCRPS